MDLNTYNYNNRVRPDVRRYDSAGNTDIVFNTGVSSYYPFRSPLVDEDNFDIFINTTTGSAFLDKLKKADFLLWENIAKTENTGRQIGNINLVIKGLNKKNFLLKTFNAYFIANFNIDINSKEDILCFNYILNSTKGIMFLGAVDKTDKYSYLEFKVREAGYDINKLESDKRDNYIRDLISLFKQYLKDGSLPKSKISSSPADNDAGVKPSSGDKRRLVTDNDFENIDESNIETYLNHKIMGKTFKQIFSLLLYEIYVKEYTIKNGGKKSVTFYEPCLTEEDCADLRKFYFGFPDVAAKDVKYYEFSKLAPEQQKIFLRILNKIHLAYFYYKSYVSADNFHGFYRVLSSPYGKKFFNILLKSPDDSIERKVYDMFAYYHFNIEEITQNNKDASDVLIGLINQYYLNGCNGVDINLLSLELQSKAANIPALGLSKNNNMAGIGGKEAAAKAENRIPSVEEVTDFIDFYKESLANLYMSNYVGNPVDFANDLPQKIQASQDMKYLFMGLRALGEEYVPAEEKDNAYFLPMQKGTIAEFKMFDKSRMTKAGIDGKDYIPVLNTKTNKTICMKKKDLIAKGKDVESFMSKLLNPFNILAEEISSAYLSLFNSCAEIKALSEAQEKFRAKYGEKANILTEIIRLTAFTGMGGKKLPQIKTNSEQDFRYNLYRIADLRINREKADLNGRGHYFMISNRLFLDMSFVEGEMTTQNIYNCLCKVKELKFLRKGLNGAKDTEILIDPAKPNIDINKEIASGFTDIDQSKDPLDAQADAIMARVEDSGSVEMIVADALAGTFDGIFVQAKLVLLHCTMNPLLAPMFFANLTTPEGWIAITSEFKAVMTKGTEFEIAAYISFNLKMFHGSPKHAWDFAKGAYRNAKLITFVVKQGIITAQIEKANGEKDYITDPATIYAFANSLRGELPVSFEIFEKDLARKIETVRNLPKDIKAPETTAKKPARKEDNRPPANKTAPTVLKPVTAEGVAFPANRAVPKASERKPNAPERPQQMPMSATENDGFAQAKKGMFPGDKSVDESKGDKKFALLSKDEFLKITDENLLKMARSKDFQREYPITSLDIIKEYEKLKSFKEAVKTDLFSTYLYESSGNIFKLNKFAQGAFKKTCPITQKYLNIFEVFKGTNYNNSRMGSLLVELYNKEKNSKTSQKTAGQNIELNRIIKELIHELIKQQGACEKAIFEFVEKLEQFKPSQKTLNASFLEEIQNKEDLYPYSSYFLKNNDPNLILSNASKLGELTVFLNLDEKIKLFNTAFLELEKLETIKKALNEIDINASGYSHEKRFDALSSNIYKELIDTGIIGKYPREHINLISGLIVSPDFLKQVLNDLAIYPPSLIKELNEQKIKIEFRDTTIEFSGRATKKTAEVKYNDDFPLEKISKYVTLHETGHVVFYLLAEKSHFKNWLIKFGNLVKNRVKLRENNKQGIRNEIELSSYYTRYSEIKTSEGLFKGITIVNPFTDREILTSSEFFADIFAYHYRCLADGIFEREYRLSELDPELFALMQEFDQIWRGMDSKENSGSGR